MMAHPLWPLYLGVVWIDILEGAGYHTMEDLAAATDAELLAVRGLGPAKLAAIRRAAPRGTAEAVPANPDSSQDAD